MRKARDSNSEALAGGSFQDCCSTIVPAFLFSVPNGWITSTEVINNGLFISQYVFIEYVTFDQTAGIEREFGIKLGKISIKGSQALRQRATCP
jgi:hypothetical protein